jgi:D-alanyl-D-alanine carboxypeptidase (penicillin-binding protein 5/6)
MWALVVDTPLTLGFTRRMLSRSGISALLATAILTAAPTIALAAPGPRGVQARGAELASGATGAVLWSRQANTERPIGSITKVMTAFLVITDGNLGREIRVPRGVPHYVVVHGASSAGLMPGDRLTARELLYALMLPSGCDAAYTLATAYGGRARFIAAMNATARRLGLRRTHFANYDGLGWPTEHSTYSTPRDLAVLGRDAMALPLLRHIVGLSSYWLPRTRLHHAYLWRTTNPLLGSYPGAGGIKTGSIRASGYCLLFEARRGGRELIGVVLDSSQISMYAAGSDAATMLNWDFSR